MILLIGLIVLLCCAGACVVLFLEQKPRQRKKREHSEDSSPQRWAQVELGPDSFHPSPAEQEELNCRDTRKK